VSSPDGPAEEGEGEGEENALLTFNGIFNDADGSGYLHSPCTPEELLASFEDRTVSPPAAPKGLAPHLDPENLKEAGWGVVWASGIDPRVRQALAPLLDLREKQAGSLFRKDLEARPGETFPQFLIRNGAALAPVNPKRLPFYLLLVGDPPDISFELQSQLDVSHAVGRLSFATPEEYARYAQGVVAAESGGRSRPRRLDVFSVQNDDDAATLSCNRYMSRPLAELLARDVEGWDVAASYAGAATRGRLAELLGGEATPALLLTCSHGLMFGAGDPLQPTDQGALLCADWPGPRRWRERIPPEYYLAAGDVPDGADLTGLIAFNFACFSAGTPERDSVSRARGKAVRRLAPRDAIAPLARRLLGKPGGTALAVIGHVDQVFEASYLWPGAGRQLETFEGFFKALMSGRRLGLALDGFGQRHAFIATLLTEQLEEWRLHPERRRRGVSDILGEAFLWLAHNDARGYMLLGDPAVRAAVA